MKPNFSPEALDMGSRYLAVSKLSRVDSSQIPFADQGSWARCWCAIALSVENDVLEGIMRDARIFKDAIIHGDGVLVQKLRRDMPFLFPKKRLERRVPRWIKCDGEAHKRPDLYDHCMVCIPFWGNIPLCPDCGLKLREGNKKFYCRSCKRYVEKVYPEREMEPMANFSK